VLGSRDAVTYARADFRKGATAEEVAEKLAGLALKRHSADNVTVVVIDLGGGKDGWQQQHSGGESGDRPKGRWWW
jgi:serine/threonine protein phosphatase PrpC